MLVDLLLVGVVLVREIVHGADVDLRGGGHVPQRLAHVADEHGVQAQILAPQELHLLVQVLVHGTADNAGSLMGKRMSANGFSNLDLANGTYPGQSCHQVRRPARGAEPPA